MARCPNGNGHDHEFRQEVDGGPERCHFCGLTWKELMSGFGSNALPRVRKPRKIRDL